MFAFCTYFDQNYLVRGLTMFRSLQQTGIPFSMWVLCLDDATFATLSNLDAQLCPVALDTLEQHDPDLLRAKQDRSRVEYYFTLTPALPLFLFDNQPNVGMLTYLDADLYFYSSPAPLFDELGEDSIGIIAHRFPPHLKHFEIWGVYNVGWLSFRNDSNSRTCLCTWREQCLDWCSTQPDGTRYADQKYLDDWLGRFSGVKVLEHKGAGLGPGTGCDISYRLVDRRCTLTANL